MATQVVESISYWELALKHISLISINLILFKTLQGVPSLLQTVFSHSNIKEKPSQNAQTTILQIKNRGVPLKLIVQEMLFGTNGQIVIIHVQLI